MLNLLSKINMSMIGSKIASFSPLMLNTMTTTDVTNATSAGLDYLLDLIVMMIVTNNEKCKNVVNTVTSKLKFWKKTAKEEN